MLLVGHSYGGAVISVAGASTPNAVGLVYVAAFVLDEGESFGEIFGRFGETPLVGAVRPGSYPLPNGETAVELTIAPELYQEAFAADLPTDVIEVLAVSQRPFAAIFEDRAEAAVGKSLPSWAIVATADKAIPPDAERFMAERVGADTIEVDASHSIALSQPGPVAEVIRTAVNATSAVRGRRLIGPAATLCPALAGRGRGTRPTADFAPPRRGARARMSESCSAGRSMMHSRFSVETPRRSC